MRTFCGDLLHPPEDGSLDSWMDISWWAYFECSFSQQLGCRAVDLCQLSHWNTEGEQYNRNILFQSVTAKWESGQ